MKNIVILGSTGSIGVRTLDVIRKQADSFRVIGLAAGKNVDLLKRQAREFKPCYLAVENEKNARDLKGELGEKVKVSWGAKALEKLAVLSESEILLSAIPGITGLLPTVAALGRGKRIALAAKEVLVAAGELVTRLAGEKGGEIIPVDSEHSAVFQCLQGEKREAVRKIVLTASGGPFLDFQEEELENVTPEEALRHPRWKMGRKVSLDSATLMNKGLEVLEAHYLFGLDFENIQVVIHPQSIVHGLVEMRDGSILAQLGPPDMRLPIQYALNYPERGERICAELDFSELGSLSFSSPDEEKFPALGLAYAAGREGGTMPAVLSAANEEAGIAFLKGEIKFTAIPRIVERIMEEHEVVPELTLEAIVEADGWARKTTIELMKTNQYKRI
jgi:1-deoxy-D-xylulose-5-phosphate reductoisomerase